MDKRRRQFLRSLQQLSESEPDCPKIELHIQHLKPLNIHCPNTECPHNTEPIIKPIQAGVDVDIASFALAELKDSFKFVFFWMGDGDLAPTIQALRSRAYNKQVQLVLANQKSLSVGLRAVLQIKYKISLPFCFQKFFSIQSVPWSYHFKSLTFYYEISLFNLT